MARQTQAELRALAEDTRNATAKAKDAAQKRRAVRNPVPSFGNLEDRDSGQTSKEVLNSRHVQGWFKKALVGKYGDEFIVSPWTVHQQKLAKDLLKVFGGDLVRRAVVFFVESWDALVKGSDGRISGVPSINLMFAMRERIFGDVQQGKKPLVYTDKRRISEYRGPVDRGIGIGW